MQDSEFLSANKMFEAKGKLYTKEMNPKPTHKSSIAAGDTLKLRGYFSEGLDSNNSWADPERLLQPVCVVFTLFSFWSPRKRRLARAP